MVGRAKVIERAIKKSYELKYKHSKKWSVEIKMDSLVLLQNWIYSQCCFILNYWKTGTKVVKVVIRSEGLKVKKSQTSP